MKKTTIYDVAEEAEVSLATVSRVINNSNVVKKETRERVLAAIDRLDFKPNQVARGLATSKSTTIAVIFPQSIFARVKDMISGIGDTGRTLDYNLMMYTTDELGDEDPVDDVIERVVKARADGVILFNNDKIIQELELMKKYNMPTAVIGYKASDEHLCSVFVDAHNIGYTLTKNYLDKGIDDIVFLKPRQNLLSLDDAISGIKDAFKDAGKKFDDKKVLSVSTHFSQNYPFFMDYLKENKPKAVIAGYDKEAVSMMYAAQDSHLSVPDDIEIIGMVDTTYAKMARPSLTSVYLPVYDMGAIAVRLITKMLNGEGIDNREVNMQYSINIRNTTKLL